MAVIAEIGQRYVSHTSSFRFAAENLDELKLSLSHQKIMRGESLEISLERRQLNLV